MKIKLIICFFILGLIAPDFHSQNLRTMSMAGITVPIKDQYNTCDPYDLGGNISFLYLHDTVSWLKINPSLNSDWGDYKRPFDAENVNLYGLNFTGVKTLGTKGTFIGSVSYVYDSRINVGHSVRYDTYRGDAFFINDSTTGTVHFNGPIVNFGYSLELIPDLYFGATAGYKIFNGLKDIFSMTSSVIRDVSGTAGLTYMLFDKAYLSAGVGGFNYQESLTIQLTDPVDDEIFNYHGDTYHLTKLGNGMTQKIKAKGYDWNSQFYIHPDNASEVGVNFVYSNSNQKVVFPSTVNGNSVLEYEDGFSYFNDYLFELKGRYDLTNNLTVGAKISSLYNHGWSKLSFQELTVWDWKVRSNGASLGAAYTVSPKLLLSLEYNFASVNADSSKYIDNHFTSITSGDHIIRLGAEYEIFDRIFVRGGAGYGFIQNDIIFGGMDIKYLIGSFGVGYYDFDSFKIDFLVNYNNYKPNQVHYSRSFMNGLISLKLFNI
jgi:hypothetical protein